jgi:flagellar basal-body rod protein FlgB
MNRKRVWAERISPREKKSDAKGDRELARFAQSLLCMPLFDATTSILEQSMNVRLDRQNLLASDLANANTPGFVAKDLDFEKLIDSAGQQLQSSQFERSRMDGHGSMSMPAVAAGEMGMTSDGEHVQSLDRMNGNGGTMSLSLPAPMLSNGEPQLSVGGLLTLDQNRVDTDHAMVALAANAINYGASAKAIAKKLAILSYCANDGQG